MGTWISSKPKPKKNSCDECGCLENNYSGKHRDVKTPSHGYGSEQCRKLDDVDGKLLCSYCRAGIIRCNGRMRTYETIDENSTPIQKQALKLAELFVAAEISDFTNVEIDDNFDTWDDDNILCATVRFKCHEQEYVMDIWYLEHDYGSFQYAHDSPTAHKNAVKRIKHWAETIINP